MVEPRYPVYVISKGRPGNAALTSRFLEKDNCLYRIVVEPQELEQYAETIDRDKILVLPFSNLGEGSRPARNWVWEHALSEGHDRHWILDDNIRQIYRRYKTERLPCAPNPAFAAIEDFVDRYENIAIGGMNYSMFCPEGQKFAPFFKNCHVYSCLLIRSDLPFRWRGRYNEDTDLCLQALSAGWCTIATNAFLIDKMGTLKMKGGNTDQLYQDDGRLKMARSLERQWPGVVSTTRKFQRAQHTIRGCWRGFDTPLIRKSDSKPVDPKTYGFKLKALGEVKNNTLRKMLDEQDAP